VASEQDRISKLAEWRSEQRRRKFVQSCGSKNMNKHPSPHKPDSFVSRRRYIQTGAAAWATLSIVPVRLFSAGGEPAANSNGVVSAV